MRFLSRKIRMLLSNTWRSVIIVLPMWYLLMWVRALQSPEAQNHEWIAGIAYVLLYYLPRLLLGVLLQHIFLVMLNPLASLSFVAWRVVAIISTLWIPTALILSEGELAFEPILLILFLPGLMIYGMFMVLSDAFKNPHPEGSLT